MTNLELINKSIRLTHCFSLKENYINLRNRLKYFQSKPDRNDFSVKLKFLALRLQIERIIIQ